MQPKLQVTLDFLHLENALFCAEQCISGGAEIIEISSLLIKNTGFNSIKIFSERFPKTPIIADLKTIFSDEIEIKAVAEAGATGITVSGAISEANWKKCIEKTKKYSIEVYLDFRGISPFFLKNKISNCKDAHTIIIDKDSNYSILIPEIIQFVPSISINGIMKAEEIETAVMLGTETFISVFKEQDSNNIKEKVKSLLEALKKIDIPVKDSCVMHNEQTLVNLFELATPGQLCKAHTDSALIKNIFPIQRFTKIIGRASTIRVYPGSQKAITQHILETPENHIIVIDARGNEPATWGILETELAIRKKIQGVIVYGAITDVNAIRERSFPCYTTSITAIAGIEDVKALYNIPIQIGTTTIQSNDWIIGDDSGVVCIPSKNAFSIANEAYDRAKEKREYEKRAEQLMLLRI